jgi:hypothetical protein
MSGRTLILPLALGALATLIGGGAHALEAKTATVYTVGVAGAT